MFRLLKFCFVITHAIAIIGEVHNPNCTKKIHAKKGEDERRSVNNFTILCASSSDFLSVKLSGKEGRYKNDANISSFEGSILVFPDIPVGKEIRIPNMELPKERSLLYVLSCAIEYLHQNEFPLGLLKLALKGHSSTNILIFQFLKMEWLSLIWIFLWGILTFCLPLSTIALLCCPITKMQRLTDDTATFSTSSRHWFKRTLDFCLHLLLLTLFGTAAIILFANEEIAVAVSDAPSFVDTIIEDSQSFIDNTETQMSFVVNSSASIGINAVNKDLDDIEDLLGRPFQRELAFETGVDVALTALEELQNAIWKAGALTSDLLKECASAKQLEIDLQENLNALSRQLMLARYQCFPKDRNLCDTLQPVGLEVAFFITNITADSHLKDLEKIGREKTLNSTIRNAIETFKTIPQQVAQQSATTGKEIRTVLNKHLTEIRKTIIVLEERYKTWSASLNLTKHKISDVLETAFSQEIWRWLAIIGTSFGIVLVWTCFICGAPCGCNNIPKTTGLLTLGLILSCIVCVLLWITGSFSFLLGTNGHTLLCQPLYNVTTLGNILDPGGILPGKGVLQGFAVGSDNIRVKHALENCRRNQTVYRTFRLNDTFNLDKTNYKTWTDFSETLGKFSFGTNLQILTPELQFRLHELSSIQTINLSKHRTAILGPITKRDLNSFEDQLHAVSRKLSDRRSIKRIEDLAFETTKIIADRVEPLEAAKDSILYKITALEILLAPLNKELNQTMSHLKTIQYYFDNQGSIIADKNAKQYLRRLNLYLSQMYSYINKQVEEEIGKCHIVWEIFDDFRYYTCSLLVIPMNALSFCLFFCIFLLLVTAHVVVKIIEHYRYIRRDIPSSTRHSIARSNEAEAWATPPSIWSPTVPVASEEETVWIDNSSRVNSQEHLIPPAPTPPPALQTSERAPDTIKSQTKTPMERFESLKVVQPISWKRSLSPRNWI